MADSGFGNISLPGKAAAQQALGRGSQLIQIVSLPKELSNIAKTLRLTGEITHLSKASVIRITTSEGEIEAKVKSIKSLQPGQRIEIEIPVGRPPQQATLRPPPVQTPAPAPAQGSTQAGITSQRPAPSSNAATVTPRDNFIRPETNFIRPDVTKPAEIPQTRIQQALPANIQQSYTPPTTPAAAPVPVQTLTAEAIIRLLGVPPAQAQTLTANFLQNITVQPANMTKVPLIVNLIAQNATDNLPQNLLQNILPSVRGQAPQITTIPKDFFTPLLQSSIRVGEAVTTPPPLLTQNFPLPQNTPAVTPPILKSLPQGTPGVPFQIPTPQSNLITPAINNALIAEPEIVQTLLPPASAPTPPVSTPRQETIIQTSLTPLPVVFDPAEPNLTGAPQIGKIDIQVLKISPPTALLTLPQTGASNPVITPSVSINSTFSPPQNILPPIISANNAVTQTAQVTGITQQGLPLVTLTWPGRTVPQTFVMQFKADNLQLGSQLQIIPKATVLTPLQTQTNPLFRGFQWPALDQLYTLLSQASPQAAASLARTLPSPASPGQITTAAMMFIAAVKSGDVAGWIGDKKLDLLQRTNRDNILSRLTQDPAQPARAGEAQSSAEWRAVPLPMFWEGQIQKITLYTRKENEGRKNKDDENSQTRFIFDLSLSRIGDVQLDGLLQGKRLDLVLRTQNAFSLPMQQTMRMAYADALGYTSLHGELNFQGSTKNWVHVLEEKEQLGMNI